MYNQFCTVWNISDSVSDFSYDRDEYSYYYQLMVPIKQRDVILYRPIDTTLYVRDRQVLHTGADVFTIMDYNPLYLCICSVNLLFRTAGFCSQRGNFMYF